MSCLLILKGFFHPNIPDCVCVVMYVLVTVIAPHVIVNQLLYFNSIIIVMLDIICKHS